MRHIIKTFLYARTSKDTAIVFAGTLVNVIAGGLFFILAPRILGPSDFGLFSTVIATGMLATNIANFGIDTGILRFAKGEDFNKILSIALKSYLFLGFFIGILGVLISPLIASFLNQSELANLLRIAFAAIIFLSRYPPLVAITCQHWLYAVLIDIDWDLCSDIIRRRLASQVTSAETVKTADCIAP